jgi:hypothetical protein
MLPPRKPVKFAKIVVRPASEADQRNPRPG